MYLIALFSFGLSSLHSLSSPSQHNHCWWIEDAAEMEPWICTNRVKSNGLCTNHAKVFRSLKRDERMLAKFLKNKKKAKDD